MFNKYSFFTASVYKYILENCSIMHCSRILKYKLVKKLSLIYFLNKFVTLFCLNIYINIIFTCVICKTNNWKPFIECVKTEKAIFMNLLYTNCITHKCIPHSTV